ncbi:hypothetical protein JOD02_001803 [Caldicoprobacter guelmensis]|nr:hypothetical protein [Caldicoprobacter guelmensis]MBM7582934.1 hypothetical protein [Caldicoprobacter guelmensis]
MFNLRYGLADESYKQCYGVDNIGWNPEIFRDIGYYVLLKGE